MEQGARAAGSAGGEVRLWLTTAWLATNAPPEGEPLPEVPARLRRRYKSPRQLLRVLGGTKGERQRFTEITSNHYQEALLASLEEMVAGEGREPRRALRRAIWQELQRAGEIDYKDDGYYVDALNTLYEAARP